MTASDLLGWCSRAHSYLPRMVDDGDLYELTKEMFPDIPKRIEFPDFAIRRGVHEYQETIRVDFLQVSATKAAYLSLGLAVIAAAFQAKDVLLTLTNEKTEYRVLSILGSEMNFVGRTGNQVVLKEFRYSPRQRSRHPFCGERLAEFPAFLLRCSREETLSTESWSTRDTVEGFGGLNPSLLLAELLLDIARPSTSENEFVLEGPAGFQGVDALSAEARFWLPGSMGYSL